jgi:hypothetical protein
LIKRTFNAEPETTWHQNQFDDDVEFLPPEQNTEEYLANFARCSVVLLPYEPAAYRIITSGVFAEAVAFGRPVVVPAGTSMAAELSAGNGIGAVYDLPKADRIAEAVAKALQASARLTVDPGLIGKKLQQRYSCLQALKVMQCLGCQKTDMEPQYYLGEEIDFSDPTSSRTFLGAGWGQTESWGVWTVASDVKLMLRFERPPYSGLLLRAYVSPFLSNNHRAVGVHVVSEGVSLARWEFSLEGHDKTDPRWLTVPIPFVTKATLALSFLINAPESPFFLGLSQDRRKLGFGLRKLICDLDTSP